VCLAKPDTIDMPPCPDNSQEDPQEFKRKLNIISLTSSFVYAKLPHLHNLLAKKSFTEHSFS
jgi:hypothetical protein